MTETGETGSAADEGLPKHLVQAMRMVRADWVGNSRLKPGTVSLMSEPDDDPASGTAEAEELTEETPSGVPMAPPAPERQPEGVSGVTVQG